MKRVIFLLIVLFLMISISNYVEAMYFYKQAFSANSYEEVLEKSKQSLKEKDLLGFSDKFYTPAYYLYNRDLERKLIDPNASATYKQMALKEFENDVVTFEQMINWSISLELFASPKPLKNKSILYLLEQIGDRYIFDKTLLVIVAIGNGTLDKAISDIPLTFSETMESETSCNFLQDFVFKIGAIINHFYHDLYQGSQFGATDLDSFNNTLFFNYTTICIRTSISLLQDRNCALVDWNKLTYTELINSL